MTVRSARSVFLSLGVAIVLAACSTPSANLNVVMTDFAFSPATYSVVPGTEVTLTLTNSGAVVHNWVLMRPGSTVTTPFNEDDEPNAIWRGRVEPGETQTFTFTAPEVAGEYPVVCSELGHLEAGMVGRLTVTP
ncbi:MAG: plastocyanin/azurin family copper-binding protein [Anaerolineales bacterium]